MRNENNKGNTVVTILGKEYTFSNSTKNGRVKGKLAVTAFLIVFFSILIVVGALLSGDQKKCTAPIDAKICSISRQNGQGKNRSVSYLPTYEFEYEGEMYKVRGQAMADPYKYDPGDRVKIYVQPSDPERVCNPENDKDIKWANILKAAGIAGIILAVVSCIVTLIKTRFFWKKNGGESPESDGIPDNMNYRNTAYPGGRPEPYNPAYPGGKPDYINATNNCGGSSDENVGYH